MNSTKISRSSIAISGILLAISIIIQSSPSAMLAYAQQTNITGSMATPTNNTTSTATSPSSREIVVVARDLEEISDNQARIALNNANYIGVLQHLNMIENNIRILLAPNAVPGISMMINPNGTAAPLVVLPNMTSASPSQ